MCSKNSVRCDSENSSIIILAYISSLRFKHLGYKTPYGIRLHLPEGIVTGIGWVKGTQPVVAQKQALSDILNAIALSERNLRPLVILWTEYLRPSLDFGHTRNKKRQYDMPVGELKTDEELFESAPILADLYGVIIRMADNEKERAELRLIERELFEESWKSPSRFSSAKELQAILSL
jgi:hypothetical protein